MASDKSCPYERATDEASFGPCPCFGISEFTSVIPKPILRMGPGHRSWPLPGLIVSVSQMELGEDNEGSVDGMGGRSLHARADCVSSAAVGPHV
jgi:hypothetical protein